MAVLIHKIKKKISSDGGVTFTFQMTPEKFIRVKKGSLTIKINSINVHRSSDILIADRDRKTQNDLEMYLSALDYSNFKVINNPKKLLGTIQKSDNVFCFCDYRILNMPDWEFISGRMDDAFFPVIALTPANYYGNIQFIYQDRVAGSLKKPIQLNALRKILFKFMGPPLKRVAQ